METKKNPKYDVYRHQGTFRNLGLALSITAVLVAFEYPNAGEGAIVDLGGIDNKFEELIEIPQTIQPPPPPPKVEMPEIIEVPDDEEIVEEDLEVELDMEITEETVIEDFIFEEEPEEEVSDEILTIVEQQPEYPGGMAAFRTYIAKNLNYPNQARRMGIEGRVYVQFVVEKDGSLTDVKVVKGIGAGCDEEAARVIKMSQNFNPGKQRGVPVRVSMVMPIYFRLS